MQSFRESSADHVRAGQPEFPTLPTRDQCRRAVALKKKDSFLTFIATLSVFFYFTFCLFRSFQCICIVYLYYKASSELLVSDINTKNRKIYNDSRLQVLSSGRPQAILRIKNVFTICNCRIKRKSLECELQEDKC